MRLRRLLTTLGTTAVLATTMAVLIAVPAAPPAAAGSAESGVQTFGTAPPFPGYNGSNGGFNGLNQPLVTMATTPSGNGYWLAAGDGGIFAFGDAGFYGSTGGMALNEPVDDMVSTRDGGGYWMVASDGGVFAFGTAGFYGSMGGRPLNQPMVTIIPTPSGQGYWTFARDGGVFAFGDAGFYGSLPGLGVTATVVDGIARPQGDGYWLITDVGDVYEFGGAPEVGSLPSIGVRPNAKVMNAYPTNSGLGYWMVSADGGVFAFGDAPFLGAASPPAGQIAIGLAATPDNQGYYVATTTGLTPAGPGQSGPNVVALQQRLSELGFWLGGVDGDYGFLTSQAVMAFQKYVGLPRTGNAGPDTVAALSVAGHAQARTTSGNIVEVDKGRQLLFIVIDGQTLVALNTSTGSGIPFREVLPDGGVATGPAVTPSGRYNIYRELSNGWHTSELGRLWRPKYFNGGIAVHGSTSIPGYPASHGCVRVSVPAMDWIWAANVMPIGRAVWVY